MTSAMTAFAIAVSSTSLVCYVLMTRVPNRRAKRGSSRDGSGSNGGTYHYPGGDGWSPANWFIGDHSAVDSSGNPSDGGGGDSGGDGGDGGD